MRMCLFYGSGGDKMKKMRYWKKSDVLCGMVSLLLSFFCTR